MAELPDMGLLEMSNGLAGGLSPADALTSEQALLSITQDYPGSRHVVPSKCPGFAAQQERVRDYQRRRLARYRMHRSARRAAGGNEVVFTAIMTAYLNAVRRPPDERGAPG